MSDLDAIRLRHHKIVTPSVAWPGEPYEGEDCECGDSWPCDTAQALAALDAARMERDAIGLALVVAAVLLSGALRT